MNLAYFRKSTYPLEETVANVKKVARENNWKMLGEVDIPDRNGKMVLLCRPEWVKTVAAENHELLGFLPCAVTVLKKGDDVLIGTGQLTVMKALVQSKTLEVMVTEAEKEIKKLIHSSAGVEELKPTHIRLYSTMTCPYCKMEKEWLENNNINHEVVYVDQDQKEAEAMVQKTGQMGVPVTEVQFSEGDPEYVIGFDRGKLSSLLGVA